jgi:hypothetical protein
VAGNISGSNSCLFPLRGHIWGWAGRGCLREFGFSRCRFLQDLLEERRARTRFFLLGYLCVAVGMFAVAGLAHHLDGLSLHETGDGVV